MISISSRLAMVSEGTIDCFIAIQLINAGDSWVPVAPDRWVSKLRTEDTSDRTMTSTN